MPEDVEPLSSAQERMLSGVLADVIKDAMSSGASPASVLAKHAMANNLPTEFTSRVAESFNTSRTLYHFNNARGEKRAESFPLIDMKDVLVEMYGDAGAELEPVKAASLEILNFYEHFTSEHETRVEKVASIMSASVEVPKEIEYAKAFKHIEKTIKQAQHIHKEAEYDCRNKKAKMCAAINKLSNSIKNGNENFGDIEARLCCNYGSELAKTAMDMLWSTYDFERFDHTRMEQEPTQHLVMRKSAAYNDAREFFSALETYTDAKQTLDQLTTTLKQAEKAASDWRVEVYKAIQKSAFELGDSIADYDSTNSTVPHYFASDSLYDVGSGEEGARGGVVTDFLGGFGGHKFKPRESAPIITPAHDARLRALKVQTMLSRFFASDPILSTRPPEDVINAVNDVVDVAPYVVDNPLIMRSLLSRIVQTGGHMDLNELETLQKVDERAGKRFGAKPTTSRDDDDRTNKKGR